MAAIPSLIASTAGNGLLGGGGGAAGTNFASPAQANLTAPVSQDQLNQAATGTQNSLATQNSLLGALQAQNGLGNQSQVYNQLQGVVNGIGPNPAQAQLAQATGANTANQAALMAGQRGSNANVGLIARQAAQQGGANQQNAAGQAATLQAQQSLNALGQQGTLANTQAAQQIGQTNANTQAQQAQQNAVLGAQQGFNNNLVGSQGSVNSGNAGLAQTQMQGQQNLIGQVTGGIGSALGLAEGGTVPSMYAQQPYAQGGMPQPMSNVGKFLAGQNTASPSSITPPSNMMAQGGKVPVLLSPGERKLSPKQAKAAAEGKVSPMAAGEKVPGKPKVGGAKNDYANDTVKDEVEEGSLILPRSVTQSKNPHWAAMRFVHEHMMANGGRVGLPSKPKSKKK